MIEERICWHGRSAIIHDPELLPEPELAAFRPESWGDRVVGQALGRGAAYFIEDQNRHWVLRHYQRGGLPGRFARETFVYTGLERSRPVREWRVLAQAFADGVPVPRPAAAALHRHGLTYTADILIERIVGARSLADLLAENAMNDGLWRALAEAVARCHQAGYWHADLNARNVICSGGQWWLIDFDRARQRTGSGWQAGNLARLRRSLDKLQGAGALRYQAADWDRFLAAYADQG